MNKLQLNYTFLGPAGDTFSNIAFNRLVARFGGLMISKTDESVDDNREDKSVVLADPRLAEINDQIVPMIIGHGGIGSIALETLAECRIDQVYKSLVQLLDLYNDLHESTACPVNIVVALKIRIHFALMARQGVSVSDLDGVLAHSKAIGACQKRLHKMNLKPGQPVGSNGEAIQLVANNYEFRKFAAIGPASSAKKNGLVVLHGSFEDSDAFTTFGFVVPKKIFQNILGDYNRTIVVFETQNSFGRLNRVLNEFEQAKINLVQIHSVGIGQNKYRFVIETESSNLENDALTSALVKIRQHVTKLIIFGPFSVQTDIEPM